MTLSCSFLLNRDQAPCVRQRSTNTLQLYFNLQYKHTFLSVCSEENILEYSYQNILEKNPSLIWYPWDKFLYRPAFVYVMEYLQPPFNLFPTAALQLLPLLVGLRNNEKSF